MSRCFPFPPPGYEKKARIDDTDLLKKEKNKEKKHKKDRKEKEKREGKEKRDKDRSKEKHREKKDRKDKHKDKDRDKEKNHVADEKKVDGQHGFHNGQKFGSDAMQNNEIEDSLYMQELARRIKDEDRASGSQMFQKVVAADQRRDEVQGVALERRGEVQGMAVERNIGYQSEEKEKVKNKNEDNRTINGQRNHFDTRGLGKAFPQNFSSMDQERVEGIVKLGEKKDAEKQMEGKEKSKNKEINVKSDKHKGKDREKNRKSKYKDRDKEEKKEEKAKEMTESIKETPKLKENVSKLKEGGKDLLDLQISKSSGTFRLSNASPAAEVNLGKRKELEKNGYLHDNETRPNKFPRQMSSSFPAVENLNTFEKCQTAILSSEKRGLANNHKVDAKEQKLNGLVIVQQPNIRSRKPSSVGILANENGEISSKPHPDVKHLSQILSIPEMEELPDANDQEWLFSSNNLQPKKPSSSSSGVDGTRQVWAEALWIESVDISALPYVIPY